MAFRSRVMSKVHGVCQNLLMTQSVRPMVSATGGKFGQKDTPTHTGQQFEDGDYRLVRFIDKKKQVNERFAVDLIEEVPPEEKKSRVVWCDGGSGPTGHPRVYINLDQPGNHSCGYCGLRFYKKDHHH